MAPFIPEENLELSGTTSEFLQDATRKSHVKLGVDLDYKDLPLPSLRSGARPIRLLKVQRRFGDQEEQAPIHCHLRVVSLADENIEYRALSYTWGPATREAVLRLGGSVADNEQRFSEIWCNGRSLDVTQNLFDCLDQMSRLRLYQDVDLWIDAICINQEDGAERASQVSIMADIYQRANQVVMWLGKLEDSTPLAHKLIGKLSGLPAEEKASIDILATLRDSSSPLGCCSTLQHWSALVEFFSRTWFTRSWVVQEYVLAGETAVLCGDLTLDWADIVNVSDFLATRVSKNTLRDTLRVGLDIESSSFKTPAKLEAVKEDFKSKNRNSFLNSLIRCRDYKCLQPHDKIYSLLGIHKGTLGTLLPGHRLYPDYGLSVAKVYRDIAVYLLQQPDSDLTLLAVVEGESLQKVAGLPSWTPDWGVGDSLGLGITGYKRYKAAGSLRCYKTFSADETTLFVSAAGIDTIVEVGETKAQVETGIIPLEWLQIVANMEPQYHTGQSRLEVFWRTLITDTAKSRTTPAPDHLMQGFLDWFPNQLRGLGLEFEGGTQSTGSTALNRASRLISTLAADDSNFAQLRQPSLVATETREKTKLALEYELQYLHALLLRLFRTSQGYLGLGSQSLKEGDSVCIVPGSRVPLILRRTEHADEKHRLVGGAYVHGFMQGEALESDVGLEFETFALI